LTPPLFTPRSARDAALSLRPTLADALRLHRALRAHAPAPGREERPVDPTYFAGVTRLLRALEAVRAAGAEIDLGRGRLRFPARREGRDVVLWWELAEPHALWHEAWEEGWEEPR
jgi:hypothetical protein